MTDGDALWPGVSAEDAPGTPDHPRSGSPENGSPENGSPDNDGPERDAPDQDGLDGPNDGVGRSDRAPFAEQSGGVPIDEVTHRWDEAMGCALAEAEAAPATGDVPVGAVVVDAGGAVLGAGHNIREYAADPTGHAELVALRAAAQARGRWRLEGCTLVVTLEPCTMCAGAIVLARLDRLVFGAWDPKAGAVGSLWDIVGDPRLNHRPAVDSGVRAEECGRLLKQFFRTRRQAL